VPWLDRFVLALIDRLLDVKRMVPRSESLLALFDDQLLVARAASAKTRRIEFDQESGLGNLTRLLSGVYLLMAAVLSIIALLVLPETRSPGSDLLAAMAAIIISPWLGQLVWHGIVNEVRFRTTGREWGGTFTIAPAIVLCLDGALAIIAWIVLRGH
jgi:hypothetical protein